MGKWMSKQKQPRVLIYDIETAPNLAWVWGKYEQNVIEYESEWYILCFAYKWLGEKKAHVLGLDDFANYKPGDENDYGLILKLHELFNEADVIVAHNGDSFDQKKSQARMIYHGLTPPTPYRQIDTKKLARKYFSFNSNKLDDLGDHLKLGRKIQTGGFSLWKGCMMGDKKAWKQMKRYNKQDVELLEKVYLKLRPWMTNHPHMGMLSGRPDVCKVCNVAGQIVSKGIQVNQTTAYKRYKCNACGAPLRARLTEKGDKPLYV